MSTAVRTTADRLLDLLPAIYRIRDADRAGIAPANEPAIGPLGALLSVIAEQVAHLEDNLEQLYDDQFIETCADSVVPYIGDLLGYRPVDIPGSAEAASGTRAEVANTIGYRRQKGTAAVLEQLARDVTGVDAKLVEFFRLLAMTPYLNHVVPGNITSAPIGRAERLELIDSPFSTVPRTVAVGRIAARRGRHNIRNVGVYLWRLQNHVLQEAEPRAVTIPADGRFWIHPAGLDVAPWNPPQTESALAHLAEEHNVSEPLRRRPLYRETEALRRTLAGWPAERARFFAQNPPFSVSSNGTTIPSAEVLICDLSAWRRPPTSLSYEAPDGSAVSLPIRVAVDPELGRIAFPAGVDPGMVRVTSTMASPGKIGGGPYDRQDSAVEWLDRAERPVTWQIGVARDPALHAAAPDPTQLVGTVRLAIEQWNTHVQSNPGAFGVIVIIDNASYAENLTGTHRIEVPAGSTLAMVSADWPVVEITGSPGQFERRVGDLVLDRRRAHLRGNITVVGTPGITGADAGACIIDGLLIEGQLRVRIGDLGRLEIAHTTIIPNLGGVTVNPSVTPGQQNERLDIVIRRSIVGPLSLTATVSSLRIAESIVHSSATAIAAEGVAIRVDAATIIGTVDCERIDATNSLFTGQITAERRQLGCIRFSHVPAGSVTPRRYHCQPDLALTGINDPVVANETAARLAPTFTALQYGHAAYGQLSDRAAPELQCGAEDGSELGAFHYRQLTLKERKLRIRIREFLRIGLETGVFHRT